MSEREDRYRRANERVVKRIVEHERRLGKEPSESQARRTVARMAERVDRERADRGADDRRRGKTSPVLESVKSGRAPPGGWKEFRQVGRIDPRSMNLKRKREV